MSKPLTRRALNRATLARQMLLTREKVTTPRAIERLVALQSQIPKPPFLALWARVQGFEREDLTRLYRTRKVVRSTTLRCTIHTLTARDYLALRAAFQPALAHTTGSILRTRMKGIAVPKLLEAARAFFAERPATFDALRDFLAKRYPKGDVRALAYFVRTHLPLVQVPTEAAWSFPGSADFTLAETWLKKPLAPDAGLEPLVLRYLAAFGPATATDFQTWIGLPGPAARAAFVAARPKLVALKDERGRELFDLPKAPRPGEDAAAPARLLPEFDNVVLSHAERRRFLADEHRRFVFLPALRVMGTLLVDGFVAGTLEIGRRKDTAVLTLQPFAALAKGPREALADEGEGLLRFAEPEAAKRVVEFAKPRT